MDNPQTIPESSLENRINKRIEFKRQQNYYRMEYLNMKRMLSSYGICYLAYLGDGPASKMELKALFNDRMYSERLEMMMHLGLLDSFLIGKKTCYRLTTTGREVSRHIIGINEIVKSLETEWIRSENNRIEGL